MGVPNLTNGLLVESRRCLSGGNGATRRRSESKLSANPSVRCRKPAFLREWAMESPVPGDRLVQSKGTASRMEGDFRPYGILPPWNGLARDGRRNLRRRHRFLKQPIPVHRPKQGSGCDWRGRAGETQTCTEPESSNCCRHHLEVVDAAPTQYRSCLLERSIGEFKL